MKIKENNNNMMILEKDDYTYLISYDSVIAKVNNTIYLNKKKQTYGLYLTSKWDYSQTTLKQLYNFIELYATQRDKTGNMFGYMLTQTSSKKDYIQKLINDKLIKVIKEEEM